jgi:hypothetical protein
VTGDVASQPGQSRRTMSVDDAVALVEVGSLGVRLRMLPLLLRLHCSWVLCWPWHACCLHASCCCGLMN